jgi:hypothetical protein
MEENKKESVLTNFIINIIIPVLVLNKLSDEKYLGPVNALIVSVIIPLGYGLYELIVHKKKNFISIIGLVSIALTGAIGLLELPPSYVAIKESFIPCLIGIIVLMLAKTKYAVFSKLIYSRQLIDVDKIEEVVNRENQQEEFKSLLVKSNILLSFSFFLSAILNYVLAVVVVKSDPGSIAYNNELADM